MLFLVNKLVRAFLGLCKKTPYKKKRSYKIIKTTKEYKKNNIKYVNRYI